jgi:hypothetical protein
MGGVMQARFRYLVAGALLAVLALAACPARDGRDEPRVDLSPEISHSRGVDGGLVLLWPRVVPMANTVAMRGPAKALQDRLKAMLEEHFPGRPIDVRPEPERVCPRRGGCIGTSIGLLIGVLEGECVAVVIVSPPGESDQLLMPWAGLVTTQITVPFREPPESSMKIQELVPCDKLPVATLEREERVRQALRIAE